MSLQAESLREGRSRKYDEWLAEVRLMPTHRRFVAIFEHGGPYDAVLINEMGADAYPVCLDIINDPDASDWWIGTAYGYVVDRVKGDRTPFRKAAFRDLSHKLRGIRSDALRIIEEVGQEEDTVAVMPLLADSDWSTRHRAASVLAKIGGPRTLVAMDVWLRVTFGTDDLDQRHHVQRCRDQLKAKLDRAAQAKE